jgi:hypothetical protein
MVEMFIVGLPGGSSGNGPATLGGILFVSTVAAIVAAGLLWLLFHALPNS